MKAAQPLALLFNHHGENVWNTAVPDGNGPNPNVVASRLTGPAPLVVLFDATATTHPQGAIDPFRQLGYRFTFDDLNSGVWQHSGKSKNEQIGGPVAAHVFETPGVYTVTVGCTDAGGRYSEAAVTITVQEPDVFYAGSNTVVISRNGDTAGAPAGAQLLTNQNSWPTFEDNKRYLLKAGQDFRALSKIDADAVSDCFFGSCGAGARPRITEFNIYSWANSSNQVMNRNVLTNIDTQILRHFHRNHDFLVFRNRIRGAGNATDFATGQGMGNTAPNHWELPRGVFIVENEVDGNSNYGLYMGSCSQLVVMGNSIPTWGREHGLRIVAAYKAFIGHNQIQGQNTGANKHLIKLNGDGFNPWSGIKNTQGATQHVVIADNDLGHATCGCSWKTGASPQNSVPGDGGDEGVQDVIFENNQFTGDAGAGQEITMGGRRITERGHGLIDVRTSSHAGALPDNWDGPYFINDPQITPGAPA